jgi:transposase
MAAEFSLNDDQWARLKPLLPNKPRGVPRGDDRRDRACATTRLPLEGRA